MKNCGYMSIDGDRAKAMMKEYSVGDKVELSVTGVITSIESRDDMAMLVGEGRKKKQKTSHHVRIDIQNTGDDEES